MATSQGSLLGRHPPCGEMELRVDRSDATARVHVRGDLDIATASRLEETVDALAAEDDRVDLDLSGVEFADAAAFHVLICACVLPRADAEVQIVESCDALRRLVELALEVAQDDV